MTMNIFNESNCHIVIATQGGSKKLGLLCLCTVKRFRLL